MRRKICEFIYNSCIIYRNNTLLLVNYLQYDIDKLKKP